MYKLSVLAAEDFADIYQHTLCHFGIDQADIYTDALENCLEMLASSPMLGRECPEIKPGLRRFDHRKHAIFFRIRQRDIFIIRILHQQRHPMDNL